MAVPAIPSAPKLTPAEAAQIPSSSLPIGSQISHLLSEFTDLSIQLLTLLSSGSNPLANTQAATAPLYDALARVDAQLARLLVMYAAHQERQRRIDALVASLRTLDSTWHRAAAQLQSCVAQLDPVVASGTLDRAAIARARDAHLTPAGLLSYARLLAPFTSAPPRSLFPPEVKLRGVGATDPTGRTLPAGAIPPFPTDAVMRRGRLQFGREGLLHGLGETEEIGGRRDGAGPGAPPDQASKADVAARLEQEAKAHEAAQAAAGDANAGDEMNEDEFEFDLDLNPDL
ncbi:uncharacterized protein JCM10292_006026 [Rhodotorula paludigena]|uniref:uncharacterized protein n=1 Tax=Rhodotorula paludigena TaxID=86838 RepID=UPI00316B51E8